MKILVLGNGGREHALIWAISQNPKCQKIYCAPGNAGTNEIATKVNIDILDQRQVIGFCLNEPIDLVVIGPEAPLTVGISDALIANRIMTFGPSKAASILEASKTFTKEICKIGKIPTARSQTFDNFTDTKKYLKSCTFPTVIKADGLASGKGVIIAESMKSALEGLKTIFGGKYGAAGNRILIEEYLDGEEASYFVLTDGKNYIPIGSAQDHKKLLDGDKGPNTGGMGAYSPAPIITKTVEKKILKNIIEPTISIMRKKKKPFKGILYAGVIIKHNEPKLIEYNVRFGDPECQVLMRRLGGQILDVILDSLQGNLAHSQINWARDAAIAIVMAAKGYPESYKKGTRINNIKAVEQISGIKVFHAGTIEQDGKLISNGGRVLNITCRDETLVMAQRKAYKALSLVDWNDGFYRTDIGWRALKN